MKVRRVTIPIGLLAGILLLGACAGPPWHTRSIRGLVPELSFTLTDDHGRRVAADDYAGKVVLVYFGFTSCRMACPAMLGRLTAVLRAMGKRSNDVRVLFVSVDPHRDTPKQLSAFTGDFAPQVIGLTGTEDQLRDLARRYRVAYSYGDNYPDGDYDVYHSSAVFVFDGRGRARLLVQDSDSISSIRADLDRLVDAGEAQSVAG